MKIFDTNIFEMNIPTWSILVACLVGYGLYKVHQNIRTSVFWLLLLACMSGPAVCFLAGDTGRQNLPSTTPPDIAYAAKYLNNLGKTDMQKVKMYLTIRDIQQNKQPGLLETAIIAIETPAVVSMPNQPLPPLNKLLCNIPMRERILLEYVDEGADKVPAPYDEIGAAILLFLFLATALLGFGLGIDGGFLKKKSNKGV